MVSAIITTHNRKKDLAQAINSIKKQTYSDLEIIVVDDGSTDGTDKFLNTVEGIKYILIDKSESIGGNHARNVGIKASHGDLIAFLDDDDLWKADKIEKQVHYMEVHPECPMVFSGIRVITGIKILDHDIFCDKTSYGDVITQQGYWKPLCVTSTMMIRKNVINELGGFDEQLKCWQEYELTLRIIQRGVIGCVNQPLVLYSKPLRKTNTNKLTNNYTAWEESALYIYNKHSLLFEKLDEKHKKLKNETYLKEAIYRLGVVGHISAMKKVLMKAYKLTGKKEYLIRYIFGLSRQQTAYVEALVRKIITIKMI